MIFNTVTVPADIRQRSIDVAEQVFETISHPDQMQATRENFNRLKSLTPDSILYEVKDSGDLAGWVVAMPTTKELAKKFLKGEIGEQEFLDMTMPHDTYEALYLCAAATLPPYRRQGVATRLTKEALLRIPLSPGYELLAWPTTSEGELALKKLGSETGKVIHIRK